MDNTLFKRKTHYKTVCPNNTSNFSKYIVYYNVLYVFSHISNEEDQSYFNAPELTFSHTPSELMWLKKKIMEEKTK